jgi:tetratricopeptide (TPR) repeat protein
MRIGLTQAMIAAVAALLLAGCNATTNSNSPGLLGFNTSATEAFASTNAGVITRPSVPYAAPVSVDASPLGNESKDALSLGKKYFHDGNFGMAERYFRRAAELRPRDCETWVDLAASYDHLGRFDLADRAYAQAIGLAGARAAILNNQGYSYLLRGDHARARQTLLAARRKDPSNRFVQNNLRLLMANTGARGNQ